MSTSKNSQAKTHKQQTVAQAITNLDKAKRTSKRNVKPIRSGGGSFEGMTIVINTKALDNMFDDLPPQLQNILDHVEVYGNGSMSIKELNDWWVSAFMDSGKIVQDVPQVLGHYRSKFNKPYKGNQPSELRELYTLTR
tara:strand:+ start:1274 stop:1687 length:414 start_codon:yes stop_codon:yes gene_type:complete